MAPKKKARKVQKKEVGEKKEELYNVEKILDKRIVRGKTQYFLKWVEFDESHNSWEPVDNLVCPEIITDFEANYKNTKLSKSKEKKRKVNGKLTKVVAPPAKKKVKVMATKKRASKQKKAQKEEVAQEEYSVQKISDKRIVDENTQCLPKCAVLDEAHSSWEPVDNLACPEIITNIEANYKIKKLSKSKEKKLKVKVAAPPAKKKLKKSNWTEHKDHDGRIFYYNAVTKLSSWKNPNELKSPPKKSNWTEHKDRDGRIFYYNAVTKRSSWKNPNDLKSLPQKSNWTERKHPDGRIFVYDTVTKQFSWKKPKELKSPPKQHIHLGPPIQFLPAYYYNFSEEGDLLGLRLAEQRSPQTFRPSLENNCILFQESVIFRDAILQKVMQNKLEHTASRFISVEELGDEITKYEESVPKASEVKEKFEQQIHLGPLFQCLPEFYYNFSGKVDLPGLRLAEQRSPQEFLPSMEQKSIEAQASEIFSEDLVQKVVQKKLTQTESRFTSLEELCDEIIKYEESRPKALELCDEVIKYEESGPKALEVNEKYEVKEELSCKICMERQMNIAFEPCGHLAACQQCAQPITKCPICRTIVIKKITIYIS